MSSSLLGTRIQHFRIVDEIGRGGMGEVYAAYDEKLERRVALKTLHSDRRFDPEAKARFLREARILSQLAHPGICQIFDLIETVAFDVLVLELIRGKNLREVLKEGLNFPSKLKIAEELAEVLVAAHMKGVIHRDLKPDNAMMTEEGRVKVLDFGLSRSIEQDETVAMKTIFRHPPPSQMPLATVAQGKPLAGAATFAEEDAFGTVPLVRQSTERASEAGDGVLRTEVGTVMGTLDYMSPEQAQGAPVTPATDIYSLGLIFQEMFTNASPYDEKPDSSFEARLSRASQGETVPVKGLDPDLTLLIERMKALEPYLRPTAVEVASLLTALKEKPGRKQKRFLMLASTTILVLFSLGTTFQALRISRERTRANQEAESAKKALEFLTGIFERIQPSGKQGPTITVKELLVHGRSKLDELKHQPLLQAKVQMKLGRLFNLFGLYSDAQPLLETARRTLEANPRADPLDVAESLNNLGSLHYHQGHFPEAEPLYLRALAMREKTLGPFHPEVASTLSNLAILYWDQGKYPQAEPLYRRALAVWEKALGPDHPDVAVGLNGLGNLYYNQSNYTQAEPLYQRALAIREKALDADHPDMGASLNNLANLYADQGKSAEAEPLYQRALAIREKALGPDHPDVASSLHNLAMLYYEMGNFTEAEHRYTRALAIREKALGADHLDLAATLNNLGNVYIKLAQPSQAEPLYKRALAIREKALGPTHLEVASTLNNLASYYSNLGRFAEAEGLLKRALALTEKAYQPDHPDVALNLLNLAAVYQRTGKSNSVEPLRNRTLAIWDKAYGSREAWPMIYAFEFSRLDAARGAKEEALQGLTRSIKKGYSNPDFATIKDFRLLQNDPRFKALVAEVRKRKETRQP